MSSDYTIFQIEEVITSLYSGDEFYVIEVISKKMLKISNDNFHHPHSIEIVKIINDMLHTAYTDQSINSRLPRLYYHFKG